MLGSGRRKLGAFLCHRCGSRLLVPRPFHSPASNSRRVFSQRDSLLRKDVPPSISILPRSFPYQPIRGVATSPTDPLPPPAATGTDASITSDDQRTVTGLLERIGGRRDWAQLSKEREELQQKVQSNTLWEDNANEAIAYQKRLSKLDDQLNEYNGFREKEAEIAELLSLAQEENDAGLLEEVGAELTSLRANLEAYSLRLMMCEEADEAGCFIELRAGAGGAEACDWVSMLSRMYQRWADTSSPTGTRQEFECRLIDEVKGEIAGNKSVVLQIVGSYAYGWCKHEAGVHRFVRISPFDSTNRRHTSFVSVNVFPSSGGGGEESSAKNIELNPGDMKVETMRAQGAGGQHVNTTDSAVRITHLPTGIVVACQSQRSQHQNKAVALDMLRAKLYERELRAKEQAKADQHAELTDAAWGSQIRSYVLHPYKMIKDLRTGYERRDVDRVLDGDVDSFMEQALLQLGKK
ncbi:uncharacterized protein EV422DRAFT_194518 [Fimicolochytrium jonesii]|uniref:uncharacterized protein n=1 Tax=Fimicolochytrium jonesii TaxID=1396493 RepID=UPI0022FE8D86|nr:uncharacterized protein EV422DRAFT_194518 [Fimicolochytrium jonesii]KAI8818217.1 hypothetical protein EV422DRAFT_194518 [Fimicolochytrium jonesii]